MQMEKSRPGRNIDQSGAENGYFNSEEIFFLFSQSVGNCKNCIREIYIYCSYNKNDKHKRYENNLSMNTNGVMTKQQYLHL